MNRGKKATIQTLNGEASHFLDFLNQAVRNMFGNNFLWSTVQIETGRKAVGLSTTNAIPGTPVLVLCVGDGASFVSQQGRLKIQAGMAGFVGSVGNATSESAD